MEICYLVNMNKPKYKGKSETWPMEQNSKLFPSLPLFKTEDTESHLLRKLCHSSLSQNGGKLQN